MNCGNCGNPLVGTETVCPFCGKPTNFGNIQTNQAAVAAPVTHNPAPVAQPTQPVVDPVQTAVVQPVQNNVETTQTTVAQSTQNNNGAIAQPQIVQTETGIENKKTKKNNLLIIILIVVVVLLVVACLYLLLGKKGTAPAPVQNNQVQENNETNNPTTKTLECIWDRKFIDITYKLSYENDTLNKYIMSYTLNSISNEAELTTDEENDYIIFALITESLESYKNFDGVTFNKNESTDKLDVSFELSVKDVTDSEIIQSFLSDYKDKKIDEAKDIISGDGFICEIK